jgi:hypothetical protein
MAASSAAGESAPTWAALLADAVSNPGVISDAYSRFWEYSVGTQLRALFQCLIRGIDPGPLNTFQGWKTLGRNVKRGQRALTLCMPVKIRKRRGECAPEQLPGGDGAECAPDILTITRFVYRNNWFVLAQTEGADYVPVELPIWTEPLALNSLHIERVPFTHLNGNVQGCASGRTVSVSPIAFLPHRTLFHEIAHVVLGHTIELQGLTDGDETTPRDIREVEAESVALICSQSLGLGGAEFSRGYIQHWSKTQSISERSAQRIFKASDAILRAGRPASTASGVV